MSYSDELREQEVLGAPPSRRSVLLGKASAAVIAVSVLAVWVLSARGRSGLGSVASRGAEQRYMVQPGADGAAEAALPVMQSAPLPQAEAAPGACTDKESCLRVIDAFLDAQPRAFGLLQVRSPKALGGGPCGGRCNLPGPCPEGDAKCRHDTYDSALAALYYTKRGQYEKAKAILDVFVDILYPTSPAMFHPKTLKTQQIGVASGKVVTLLAASYNKAVKPAAGDYEAPGVMDGAVDTGNNAWAALAFAHFAAATSSSCHAVVARDILGAIVGGGDCSTDVMAGYMGHLEPYVGHYRSAEHNVDLFGLAKVLGDETVKNNAGRFVASLFNTNRAFNGTYATGTGADRRCDHSVAPGYPIAVDATFWNILADADPDVERLTSALRFALETPGPGKDGHKDIRGLWVEDVDLVYAGEPREPTLSGVRFSTQGNGVQWENTAGAVMAMIHFIRKYGDAYPGLSTYIEAARNSMKLLLNMYAGMPSSVLGGNYVAWQGFSAHQPVDPKYPGGTDTGLGWPYLRYLATAPTAWTGLLLLYQADASQPVDEDANPYAVPAKPMPRPDNDMTCIPVDAMRQPDAR